MAETQEVPSPVVADRVRTEVEALLYEEARLLDGGDHRSWLELFGEGATYWVPLAAGDPSRHVSIAFDDRTSLRERVGRLEGGHAHAQEPASATVRAVSNIEVLDTSGEGIDVESVVMVSEYRRGVQSLHAARCRYRLIRDDERRLVIEHKRVDLVNSTAPLGSLSILI